ncbi:MAG: hypothetical protein ACRC7O_06060 [Fimbriiglobus sp.]
MTATTTTTDIVTRIHFILHRGFVEARNLAYDGRTEQLADLADAMELIPSLLNRWDEDSLEMVRFVLTNYEQKYPTGRYDYSPYLDRWPVPVRY